jgi:dienelactone hydrolase
VHLIGYLARPGAGLSALIATTPGDVAPYPAVVVLHGCGGISSHSAAIADRFGGWGYVALAIDTLGPRGMDRERNRKFADSLLEGTVRCELVSNS